MPALDGLRAVAIVLVVASHVFWNQFVSGQIGVDVFFVLSGFLITALIAADIGGGLFSRRRFYLRRMIRLMPALFICVVVFTPLGLVMLDDPMTWVSGVIALLYLTWFCGPAPSPTTIFRHTWTLGVEEWFYLLWPLILAKMQRDNLTLRQIAAFLAFLAVVGELAMIIGPGSLIARPAAIEAGVALALWWVAGGRFRRPSLATGAGLVLIFVGGVLGDALWAPMPFWLAVGGAVLVVGGVASGARGWTVRLLELRPMVAIGVVSYEWYLLHFPMIWIAKFVWGDASLWLVVPASLALSFALHYALVPLQSRLRAWLDGRHKSVRRSEPGQAVVAP